MPKVSIIVCTYNREGFLYETLQHLNNQKIDAQEYEVVVVDNNSSDQSAEVIKGFLSKNFLFPGKYFLEKNQGLSYARNRGIKEACGQYLAFVDDDALVTADYVEQLILFFEANSGVSVLGGKIVPLYETKEPEWMTKYLLPLVAALDMGDIEKPFKGSKFPIGANMAFRKEIFERYGVFNVELGRKAGDLGGGEEKDMMLRLKKEGESIYYVPSVKVDHVIPEKRLQKEYIKKMAIGVGLSEKKRIERQGVGIKIDKMISEFIKIAGTFVLFLLYSTRLEFSKAKMLVVFRWWVTRGYLTK